MAAEEPIKARALSLSLLPPLLPWMGSLLLFPDKSLAQWMTDYPNDQVGFVPLRVMRPDRVENGQEKCPGFSYRQGASTSISIPYKRKRGMQAGSKPAESNIEQKSVLFDNTSGSRTYSKGDKDADFDPPTSMDGELAIVDRQKSGTVDDCDYPDDEVGFVPLKVMMPDRVETGQEKLPGFSYRQGASTNISITYKRKRGMQAGSKPAESNVEQKSVLFDNTSGSPICSKGDKDADFEPPTPMGRRVRLARSTSANRKIELNHLLVDSSSSSSTEGKKDEDYDYDPAVSDGDDDGQKRYARYYYDDDGQKRYARVKGTAWDRAVEVEERLPAKDPSFLKCMTHSQVVKGFWLSIPAFICRDHLPKHDGDVELEDEGGQICKAQSKRLIGGWRGFVKHHDLKMGDSLVFHLVGPLMFKVYILGENKFSAADAALGLMSLGTSMENNASSNEEEEESSKEEDTKSKEEDHGTVYYVPRENKFSTADAALALLSLDTSMGNNNASNKEEESCDEDIRSKEEEPEVVTGASSRPSSDDLASEDAAVRFPGSDTGDFIAVKSPVDFKNVGGDGKTFLHWRMPSSLQG